MNNRVISGSGKLVLILILSSSLGSHSCLESGSEFLSEGSVKYRVEYQFADNDIPGSLMPSSATTYFVGSRTSTTISAAMGMFEITIISDPHLKEYRTLISAFGQKVALVLDEDRVMSAFEDRVPFKVSFTSNQKIIAGMNCNEAIIRDSLNNEFTVYYTDQLGGEGLNWGTPFRDIEGVLMEYSMNFGGSVMKLVAVEIEGGKVPESVFKIPEDFDIITDPEHMDQYL